MKDEEAIQWRPWDANAFREARDFQKPIFLSITAPWCHWCHVMDEESFTHPEIIRRLRADFIPVRVDSDKRPDINSRYNMGGWPTVAILNSDGKVAAGATYLPIGQLMAMLASVKQDPDEREDSDGNTQRESGSSPGQPPGPSGESDRTAPPVELDGSLIRTVGGFLKRSFDPEFGGFGGPPKFPQPWAIDLAFNLGLSTGDAQWSEMAKLTLDNMRDGGIYDAVDGGFFRYATRGDWDNPHYEKLLETNARMVSIYLKAYKITGETAYRGTAQGILDYLFLVLLNNDGWFCGSQSADQDYYGLTEDDRIVADGPSLDRTVYTDSNMMAASALFSAYHIFGDSKCGDGALKLIDLLWGQLYRSGDGMFHYRDATDSSVRMLSGHLADQVYTVMALVDAFEATGNRLYLFRAEELAKIMDDRLWDHDGGGFCDLPMDAQALGALKMRIKPFVDNAAGAIALIRLYHLTGAQVYQKRAEATLRHLAAVFMSYKQHAAPFAVALEKFLNPPCHIAVVGKRGEAGWMELLCAAHRLNMPWKVVLPLDRDEDAERLRSRGYPASDKPLAYLCIGKICLPPISRPEDLSSAAKDIKA
jgi:uncharacterized protein YyaL (SSP411 family)